MDAETGSAEFWAEVEAGIESDDLRELVRKLVDRQRETGRPSTAQILDTLRDRQNEDQARSEFQLIVDSSDLSAAGVRAFWRQVRDWGMPRYSGATDSILGFPDLVAAQRMFAKPPKDELGREPHAGDEPVVISWLKAWISATRDLLSQVGQVESELDARSLHSFVMALERVLEGRHQDVGFHLDAVEVVIREIERREAEVPTHGADDQAARTRAAALRQHADGSWGRAMLRFLYEQPGRQAATSDVVAAGIDVAADDEHLRKTTVQECLRRLRAFCQKCHRDDPCREHLGLIDYPSGKSRGWLMLTDAGVGVARRQIEEDYGG